ncbi:MAG: hypothetical protein NC218_07215 [Acetobacter sp.]|nr:hypothetical protein [Acetobacter sp.]
MNCPICGHPIPPNSGTYVSIEDGTYVLMCNSCGITYGHSCLTCRHQQAPAPQCLYEKYQGPLDIVKIMYQEQRIGPMVMRQEAPQVNVEVIEQVCPTCPCGTPHNCQRNHICPNWEVKEELLPYVISTKQEN